MDLEEEREFTLCDAEQRIGDAYDALCIRRHTTCIGESPCAVLTELYDADEVMLTGGWGKGERAAARVGSLYEAMEHYLMEHHSAHRATVQPVETLIQGLGPTLTSYLPGALLADQLEETIATRRYNGFSGTPDFDYPVALSAPHYVDAPLPADSFDYGGLRRYASSSGTAIGGSLDEALLHALNECAERDALSLFLLTHFFHRRDVSLTVITPDGLPNDVAALYRSVAERLGSDICLLDISSVPGITCCLAIAHQCYDHARPHGAGASLNPAHAARRALHELLQSHLALQCPTPAAQKGRDASVHPQVLLQDWPRLQRCAAMDIEARLDSQPSVVGRLDDRPAGAVATQVKRIATLLLQADLQAGYHVVRAFENGITLVNVVVPRFERFYVVTLGHVVVPGERGGAPLPAA